MAMSEEPSSDFFNLPKVSLKNILNKRIPITGVGEKKILAFIEQAFRFYVGKVARMNQQGKKRLLIRFTKEITEETESLSLPRVVYEWMIFKMI